MKMMIAVIVATLVVVAGMALLILPDDNKITVKLMSDDAVVGSETLSRGDLIDTDWLYGIEAELIAGESDLYFAGWYTDPNFTRSYEITKGVQKLNRSYESAFYDLMPINSSMTLYAKWSTLGFSMEQTNMTTTSGGTGYDGNRETCTFTIDSDTTGTVQWIIEDTYKTSYRPRPTSSTPPKTEYNMTFAAGEYTASLPPGRYDVTLTVGEEKLTRTVIVEGDLYKKFVWDDYYGNTGHVIECRFDVNEYLLYAEMNRRFVFRVSQVANFVLWDTPAIEMPVIKKMANDLMEIAEGLGMDPLDKDIQRSANLITSFVNLGTRYEYDSVYYSLPRSGGGLEDLGTTEYYKYPVESLYDEILYSGAGDCEDTAILVAALAKAFGFEDVAIITFTQTSKEGHAVAGFKDASFVRPPEQSALGAYFSAPSGYYVSETTGGNAAKFWVGNLKFGNDPGWTVGVHPVKR